jgi:hypothetical protein
MEFMILPDEKEEIMITLKKGGYLWDKAVIIKDRM